MTGAVAAAHVDYHAPAKFDDELSLWSRCVSMGKVRFRVEYEVWREADGALVASGYTEHAMLSHLTLRPVRVPEWVKAGSSGSRRAAGRPLPTPTAPSPWIPPSRVRGRGGDDRG